MPNEKAFRRSFFGLSRRDIYNYLEEVSRKTEEELQKKDKALEEMNEVRMKLEAENRALAERVKALEEERGYISNAIMRAENEAAKILENATREAQLMKSQLEAEIKAELDKLERAREEVIRLKTAARDIVRSYEEQLGALVNEGAPDVYGVSEASDVHEVSNAYEASGAYEVSDVSE